MAREKLPTRQNVPFLAFNRGLISPKSLARVDIDRTRLSAEVFTNWQVKTQGAMSLRPGTKYFGSSLNDTGAMWIEFVSATDDVALLELANDTGSGAGAMRMWLGTDAHDLTLLGRPAVDTTVSLSDTGWSDASIGGELSTTLPDLIPAMTAATTNGVRITASTDWISAGFQAWRVGDDNSGTEWVDTGSLKSGTLPSWLNVDFGSGNTESIGSYSLRAPDGGDFTTEFMASAWRLLGANFDTGTFAIDTGKWSLEDSRSSESGWATGEKRTYTAQNDTGSTQWRHWRLHVVSTATPSRALAIAELELFSSEVPDSDHVQFSSGTLTLNATAIGARAIARKRVIVSDTGTEHSLDINISRGPIIIRVGSTDGDDDYIRETSLGTGYHNLAFTPQGNFWIRLQSTALANRTVQSLQIGDSGTVEVRTPWQAANLDNIRYDQSADVVYADCLGIAPRKIERRGTGRSWSVVDYEPTNGPFLTGRPADAKLSVSHFYGNTTMESDVPVFTANHVGALYKLTHDGQSGEWALGALDAVTDAVKVVGITDSGSTITADNERRIVFTVAGTWSGGITIERSFDGPDFGFKKASANSGVTGNITDTGTFTTTIDDPDDNLQVWYRAKITSYTSGVAVVRITYKSGQVSGIVKVTNYNNNQSVNVEVISRLSDTGTTKAWQEGTWSMARGYPTAVALHGGRLAHANGANLFLSVSDDFENFDQDTVGDAGPIIRTLGSGPVDVIHYLVSLLRLIVGTSGQEMSVRSSSLDEPLTPDNCSINAFSTQGSANIRAIRMDTRAVMIQRSQQRLFMIGPAQNSLADYESFDLTLLAPDLLDTRNVTGSGGGVVSIAIQRQPDTRIHCVLASGSVAILTYEPQEEVICWTKWETDGFVEKAMVLPGVPEDAVYYHIRRTINGQTKRYLEKWPLEAECTGDTGFCWLADCAVSFSDTGRSTTFADAATHLAGENVIAWGDLDTGSTPYVDLSPDVDGVQTTYTVDTGGDVAFTGLTEGVQKGVLGLPYQADWKSTKLAYAAQMGTALAQYKRVDKIGLLLYETHANGLFYGSDTGHLDPLPRVVKGEVIDPDTIFATLDAFPTPFNGAWSEDSRVHIRAKAPRPTTVLALVPTVSTEEKV